MSFSPSNSGSLHPLYAYVGSRTTRERDARGDGISVYRVDTAEGALELVQTVQGLVNPSFLILNKRKNRLYTVHGDGHEVSVFEIDRSDGRLHFMQRQECGGCNPVHLALSPDEDFLIVADHLGMHSGGSVLVMPVSGEGSLGTVCQRIVLPGEPGPHRKEQPFAKPHFNPFDPSGRFILVPDKGQDKVFVFRFDKGVATPAESPFVMAREGSGPRHIVFHPSEPYVYVINELDSSVTTYLFDAKTGHLHPRQVVPTLPSSFTGNSRAAGIALSGDARTLYASNRGHDSIVTFRIAPQTGLLDFLEATATGGKTPRFFALAPDSRFMFVLNEDSDSIRTFAVDAASGRLTETPHMASCGSPVCLVFG